MKIGLLVAIEMDSIFAHYKDLKQLPCPTGFELYHTKKEAHEVFVLRTGMGEIAASAGVQYLATACEVEMIVNFGVVGGLTTDMKQRKVCVIDRVVHYKYDCSEFMDLAVGQVDGHDSVFLPTTPAFVEKALAVYPELKCCTCCSGDKFVGTVEEKQSLHDTFEGDVCDMESAGVVLACELNGLPCLMLKAVADGLADGAKGFYDELLDAGSACLAVADKIIDAL